MITCVAKSWSTCRLSGKRIKPGDTITHYLSSWALAAEVQCKQDADFDAMTRYEALIAATYGQEWRRLDRPAPDSREWRPGIRITDSGDRQVTHTSVAPRISCAPPRPLISGSIAWPRRAAIGT